jgi:hypothetical protein
MSGHKYRTGKNARPGFHTCALFRNQVKNGCQEYEKGRKTDPFRFIFLLPVGLADFMGQTLRCFEAGVNRESGDNRPSQTCKKAAPYQGRGQVDREEVTTRTAKRRAGWF